MEAFFGFVLIIALGVPVLRFFMSRVPQTSSEEINRYKSTLPEGFGYPYFLDETGHAINVKENQLLITANGKQHIYGLDQIRGFRYVMNGADQIHFMGAGVQANVNAGLKNRALRKDAYKNNGIFVEVADIDTPVLQIKYSDEGDMRRSVEILQQFLYGTLMDYQEYMKQRA